MTDSGKGPRRQWMSGTHRTCHCQAGVYASVTRQLDTIRVNVGSLFYFLDISCKWSRVYLDILREIEMMAAKRHEKRVGYIRVSAIDQNTERQLEGVQDRKSVV